MEYLKNLVGECWTLTKTNEKKRVPCITKKCFWSWGCALQGWGKPAVTYLYLLWDYSLIIWNLDKTGEKKHRKWKAWIILKHNWVVSSSLAFIIYFPWIEETRNIRLAIRSALSNFALREGKENIMLISRFSSLYFVFKLFISSYFLNHWHESIEITSMLCWRGVLQTCRLGSCTNSREFWHITKLSSKQGSEIDCYLLISWI